MYAVLYTGIYTLGTTNLNTADKRKGIDLHYITSSRITCYDGYEDIGTRVTKDYIILTTKQKIKYLGKRQDI